MNFKMNPTTFNPIGFASTWFKTKNGTPRQPTVCPLSRGTITISKDVFSNPEHALEGLESFSHVWIIFLFHCNDGRATKAKVAPPRLGGKRVGLFSTRSPHRPNPIGLTLAKLESISGPIVQLSGLDLLDGTPILDIKPYIPTYDNPCRFVSSALDNPPTADGPLCEQTTTAGNKSSQVERTSVADIPQPYQESLNEKEDPAFSPSMSSTITDNEDQSWEDPATFTHLQRESTLDQDTRTPDWTGDKLLPVTFTKTALHQLSNFSSHNPDSNFSLLFLKSTEEAKSAIVNILSQDPRSVYRKTKCLDRLYFCMVDSMHVTSWFDDEICTWQVLRIVPVAVRKRHTNSSNSVK